jgi:predicted metal-dependent peptidase
MAESLQPGSDTGKVRKELIKVIINIARHKEFYGHIVQQLEKVWVRGEHRIQTAAVGRFPGERFIKMWVNTDFFGSIFSDNSREQARIYISNVLEHELVHLVFGHLFLHFEDKTRGSVAVDCVVNGILNPQDNKKILPVGCVHPAHYKLPLDKSAMWYYTHLRDNPKYIQQCKSGAFGMGGVFSHILSGHAAWDDIKDDPVSQEFAKDIIRKSKELCGKQYGKIPGAVQQQIEELLRRKKSIVPWGRVLRMFCASAQESILDYTVKKVSKRYGTRPGTRKGDVLKLAVCLDTSGSISDEQLVLFWNEIRWVWKNGADIWIYECDAKISERSPFRFNGKWDGKVHGRGGTDLEPPLKECEGKYDALIYFTDFYAPVITTQYRIPTLWVLTTELEKDKFPYKWGKHIKIEDGTAAAA